MLAIKNIRQSKSITQKDLAEKVGVDRSTVTCWENGSANPTVSKLPAIAAALGCTIDDLFGTGGK